MSKLLLVCAPPLTQTYLSWKSVRHNVSNDGAVNYCTRTNLCDYICQFFRGSQHFRHLKIQTNCRRCCRHVVLPQQNALSAQRRSVSLFCLFVRSTTKFYFLVVTWIKPGRCVCLCVCVQYEHTHIMSNDTLSRESRKVRPTRTRKRASTVVSQQLYRNAHTMETMAFVFDTSNSSRRDF